MLIKKILAATTIMGNEEEAAFSCSMDELIAPLLDQLDHIALGRVGKLFAELVVSPKPDFSSRRLYVTMQIEGLPITLEPNLECLSLEFDLPPIISANPRCVRAVIGIAPISYGAIGQENGREQNHVSACRQ
jgi:hypothetical protein